MFIPGVGGREWLWEHQITNLGDVASSGVMVLDRQDTRAEMAHYVLDQAPERFSIAGHSLGGWVAQEVAALAPERVSKLFLCDTCARKPDGTDEYLENFWTHARRRLLGPPAEGACGRLQHRRPVAADHRRHLGDSRQAGPRRRGIRSAISRRGDFRCGPGAHRGGGPLLADRTAAGVHRGDATVADSLAFQFRYRSGIQRAHGR